MKYQSLCRGASRCRAITTLGAAGPSHFAVASTTTSSAPRANAAVVPVKKIAARRGRVDERGNRLAKNQAIAAWKASVRR